ncbi:MAG: trehalose-6-phosphate synthase, partial [Rhodospirillales bacterium]|nr:trehalose-6-phosphate synthase [Rhodospirillales bacterium]
LGARPVRSAKAKDLRNHPHDRTWLVGVDRLDYSKGLVDRLRSFERFLQKYSQYRGKVTLVQIAPPSRSEVPEYKDIQRMLATETGQLNGSFGDFDWVPVNYLNRSFNRQELVGFYRGSRVGLITPLRDGMNLVAKEYVASQDPEDPGVLVLSRFAGAARELEGALIVNPFDYDGTADAIARALCMAEDERKERWNAMMEVLRSNTLTHWRDAFISALAEAPFE